MAPERDAPSVETLLQRYESLSASCLARQAELEEQLHGEILQGAWRWDWEKILRLVDAMPSAISRKAAGECMFHAVQSAPSEVVAALLERLPRWEYAERETYVIDWSPVGEPYFRNDWEISVQGTLVMHAVAANRPECLKLLLEQGHDGNSASSAAATALLRDRGNHAVSYGLDYIPFHAFTARPESRVCLRQIESDPEDLAPLELTGATPLALAVLMGHESCARILLEHGVWREQVPSVSQVLWLACRKEDEAYRRTRSLVLEWGGAERPVLRALVQNCSPKQLKTLLETYSYNRKELIEAARAMLVAFSRQRDLWKNYADGWRDLCRRLYLLGRIMPEVLCVSEVGGLLVDHACRWKESGFEMLLPLLKGQTLDLSEISSGLYYLTRSDGKKLLERLSACCDLVIDPDVIPPETPAKILRLFLKHVRFLPPGADRGISGLTLAILNSGDLRLIRRSLETGVVSPWESTEDLLNAQQELKLSPVCRSLLLTVPRSEAEGTIHASPLSSPFQHRWFAEKTSGKEVPVLAEANWERWCWPTLRRPYGECRVEALGETWQLHHVFFAACILGREELVKWWLERLPKTELRNTSFMVWEDHITLTPLCVAALGGQTRIVRLLLEHGASAEETLYGNPCVFEFGPSKEEERGELWPIHALMVAILGGHWDTAELLLRHGAVCDLKDPALQALWNKFHKEPLEETVRYHLGAYISGQTLQGGERDDP